MADKTRDLADLVVDALNATFVDIVDNDQVRSADVVDALRLLSNLAGQGVGVSVEDYVDTSEHAIQIVCAHGDRCEGCRQIQDIAFGSIARSAVNEYRERGL